MNFMRNREIEGIRLPSWERDEGDTPRQVSQCRLGRGWEFQVGTTRSRDQSCRTGQQRPPVHIEERL